MSKIAISLWFDNNAEEAAEFYLSVFNDSNKRGVVRYPSVGQEIHGGAAGSVMTVDFDLAGLRFTALNGGPLFTFNPSTSFILNFDPSRDDDAAGTLDRYWDKLSEGGTILMEKQAYPFSKQYGWVQDKFGISWQLMLTNPEGEDRPFITPQLMFAGDNTNKAEEAMTFYTSIFNDSRMGTLARYPEDTGPANAGSLMFADFMIEGTWMSAMDSGVEHSHIFNEAISFIVNCDTQEEIDYYWEKLSAVPEAEQCGWLKDKFGVSWQIVPRALDELMAGGDEEKYKRSFAAMMKMKKLDIETLKNA